jgi:Tfp pilus assembly protein PilO
MLTIKNISKEYLTTLGLVWIAAGILFVFAYMLFLKPQAQVKQQFEKKLTEMRQDYASAVKASNENVKKQLAEEVEQLEERLGQFVADADKSADITFDISKIANKHNVSSFSIKSKDSRGFFPIPQCELIGENKIDVSFNGKFEQFARFLNNLERYSPAIFVNTFSIKSDRSDPLAQKVDMGLSVLVEKPKDG